MKKICLFVIISFTILSAAAQTLTLSGSPNIDISGLKQVETVDIPLKIDMTTYGKLRLTDTKPFFVRVGSNSNDQFKNAVTINKDPKNPALILTVDVAKLYLQGSYEVSLLYYFVEAPDDAKAQAAGVAKATTLTFNLVRAAGVLEGEPVIIKKDGGETSGSPLVIRETGRRTSLKDLTFTLPNVSAKTTKPLLTFPDKVFEIHANEQKPIKYIIDPNVLETLPLGKTSIKLYGNSNLLQSPFTIQVEITRNIWKGYIIVTVFCGLLIGLFVRHYLKSLKDNETAKGTALQLLLDMYLFKKEIHDTAVVSTVNQYINDVNQNLKKLSNFFNTDPSQLLTAVQADQTKFDQLKQDFSKKMADLKLAIMTTRDALYSPNLPGTFQKPLEPIRALLPEAKTAIDNRDLTTAGQKMQMIANDIGGLVANYKSYVQSVCNYLLNQKNYPADTDNTFAWATPKIAIYQTAISAIAFDPANFNTGLLAVNNFQNQLEEFPNDLKVEVQNDFKKVNSNAANDGNVIASLEKWVAMIKDIVTNTQAEDDPIKYVDENTLDNLNIAWKTAQTSPAVEDQSIPLSMDFLGGQLDSIAPFSKVQDNRSNVFPIFTFDDQRIDESEIRQSLASAKGGYLWSSIIQTTMLTLLIGLGAYKSYETDFTGTFSQLITIFLFAFSLDIAVESISQFKNKLTFS